MICSFFSSSFFVHPNIHGKTKSQSACSYDVTHKRSTNYVFRLLYFRFSVLFNTFQSFSYFLSDSLSLSLSHSPSICASVFVPIERSKRPLFIWIHDIRLKGALELRSPVTASSNTFAPFFYLIQAPINQKASNEWKLFSFNWMGISQRKWCFGRFFFHSRRSLSLLLILSLSTKAFVCVCVCCWFAPYSIDSTKYTD